MTAMSRGALFVAILPQVTGANLLLRAEPFSTLVQTNVGLPMDLGWGFGREPACDQSRILPGKAVKWAM